MVRIRISLDDAQVGDLNSVIRSEMDGARISSSIKPGSTVAITVGSRGITDIARITAYIVKEQRELNFRANWNRNRKFFFLGANTYGGSGKTS